MIRGGIRNLRGNKPTGNRAGWGTRFVCLVLCLSFFSEALATVLSQAREAFIQGDLPRTIKLLEPQLFPKTMIKGRELQESLQIYGITQFMVGNTKKSERAFKLLLNQNPNASLDKRYVLDPAIEPYFSGIKKQSAPKQPNQGNSKTNRAVSDSRQVRIAQPTPPPEVARAKPQTSPRVPTKRSFSGVLVNSNAPRTTVFLDGILVGSAGQPISLDPGTHLLTLSAEGYESIERRISVESGRTANLSVSLKKIAAAEKPRSQTNAPTNEKSSRNSKKEKNKIVSADDFKNNKPKRSVNFNNALPETKGSNRSSRPQKSLADQFFQEQQSTQSYPQPYPQPAYPTQPVYPQPVYPQPVYPQPTIPYPAQPGYGTYPAPYQAPPVYSAPPPAYSYPSPDPYGSPSYPPPPASQYGAPNPYEEEYEAADGAPPRSFNRSDSVRSSSRRRANTSGSAALAVLPLGIGQFQNGDAVKGGFFLLSEGGALGYGLYLSLKVVASAEKQFALDREAEENDLKNGTLKQQDIDAKELEREKYIQGQKSLATWCYVGAGALYVLGVIDAFVNLEKPQGRKRADFHQDNRTFTLGLQPSEEGGIGLKFSMKID